MGRVKKNLLIGLWMLVAGLVAYELLPPRSNPTVSPVPEERQPILAAIFAPKKNPEELKRQVEEAIGDSWKNYSLLVEDYHSDFRLGINETEIFTAASVNKVPILATLYYLVQKGEANLDRIITLQASDIQNYGTGSIRYDPPGTTYSVKTLARLMMQQSDNTAAFLLGNYVVGMDKIQALLSLWGLVQTDMLNNKTSNQDMANLFRKIITEKAANRALTSEMLIFLKDSEQEDRLPAMLPKEVKVYHKTGNAVGGLHDAGIIEEGKTKYYLGIFTSDITDDNETVKLMAKVSKVVWDFMH